MASARVVEWQSQPTVLLRTTLTQMMRLDTILQLLSSPCYSSLPLTFILIYCIFLPLQTDEAEVINFLLTTEIIPLCLRIMESGSELSKTVSFFFRMI